MHVVEVRDGIAIATVVARQLYTDVTYVRVGQSPAAVEKVLERTNKRLEANREPIVRGHP